MPERSALVRTIDRLPRRLDEGGGGERGLLSCHEMISLLPVNVKFERSVVLKDLIKQI